MSTKIIIISVVVVVVAAAFTLAFLFSSSGAISKPATDTAQSGKINIVAVCEGALAYMSFPDGASADAFVQECIEGKHPEVIEQWKQQQGITDDRAI